MAKNMDRQNSVDMVMGMPMRVVASIKNMLTAEEKKLISTRRKLKKEDPFADSSRTMDNAALDDEVSEQVGHERVQAIRSEMDNMLTRIRKSLIRIKMGKYGSCAKCGKKIDMNRLLVNPTAEYCVSCERQMESEE